MHVSRDIVYVAPVPTNGRYFADTIFQLIFRLKIGLFWLKIVLIRSWGTSPFSEQLRAWFRGRAGKRNHEAKGIKVNHHMMTSSNRNIFRVTGPLWGNSPVIGEFPSQRQWRGALMFSLIWAWINGWVNNRETGDLRRHRAHYGVIVMKKLPEKVVPSKAWN